MLTDSEYASSQCKIMLTDSEYASSQCKIMLTDSEYASSQCKMTKDYRIGICYFSTAIRIKNKDWL
jgi:hypothetical protein